MAAFNKYNCFLKDAFEKKHDFVNDVFKVALTNRLPVVTDRVLADIVEIAVGNGYTAGGNAATFNASAQSSGTYKSTLNDPATWTASGGSIATFQYAVLYNSTPGGGLVVGYWNYGSAVVVQSGETFVVDLDQVNGIFTDV